jgi:hypothetical protein
MLVPNTKPKDKVVTQWSPVNKGHFVNKKNKMEKEGMGMGCFHCIEEKISYLTLEIMLFSYLTLKLKFFPICPPFEFFFPI